MTDFPTSLSSNPVFLDMLRDFERANDDREEAAAKADPVKHKKTKLFRGGLRYRYWPAGKDGRGREIRFAYTTTRNVAGYFLGFREVVKKDGSGFRDDWFAHKRKQTIIDRQEKLAQKQKARGA